MYDQKIPGGFQAREPSGKGFIIPTGQRPAIPRLVKDPL